jgi:outer membrane protein TolC
MKPLSVALRMAVALAGLACAGAACGAGQESGAGRSISVAAVSDHALLELDAPTTLRLVSRKYFPESGTIRARFIRRVAAANPEIFANAQAAFDQQLAAGQRLKIPTGLLPTEARNTPEPATAMAQAPSGSAAAQAAAEAAPAASTGGTAAGTPRMLDVSVLRESPGSTEPAAQRVSLKSFAAMIARSDEMVRAQRLEESIADESVRGAKGIFEPFMFMAMEREGIDVLTSAQDAQRLGVRPRDIFNSRESRVKTGMTMKALTGADVELSYNMSTLKDSIQPDKIPMTSPEYKGYVGAKITQPLWRGAGQSATKAGISIAETEKGVARETVRQLTAQRVMEGLQTYIFVQRAEARVRLRTLALDTATEIEREMAQQNAAGLRSAAELTESRSSRALRRAQLAQAQQDLEEQQNLLQVFISAREPETNAPLSSSVLRPADQLELPSLPFTIAKSSDSGFAERLDSVMTRRPEARVNSNRIEREGRKLEQARDQAKPELNLVLRGGKEDLSSTTRSLSEFLSSSVPYKTWFAGITLKIGLFDDEKKTSEYQTAALRRQQAQLALGAVRQRIANEVQASGSVLDKSLQQAARQREIVDAQRALLKVERELVREGRRSMLDVLKKQAEVLLAEEALSDAVAQVSRASYLTSQVEGTLLSRLELE